MIVIQTLIGIRQAFCSHEWKHSGREVLNAGRPVFVIDGQPSHSRIDEKFIDLWECSTCGKQKSYAN